MSICSNKSDFDKEASSSCADSCADTELDLAMENAFSKKYGDFTHVNFDMIKYNRKRAEEPVCTPSSTNLKSATDCSAQNHDELVYRLECLYQHVDKLNQKITVLLDGQDSMDKRLEFVENSVRRTWEIIGNIAEQNRAHLDRNAELEELVNVNIDDTNVVEDQGL